MLDFFTEERGIKAETLDAWAVELDQEGNRAVFRYPNGTKYRAHIGDERRFWSEPKGAELGLLFGPPDKAPGGSIYIVEGETDAMRLWQEYDGEIMVVCLPGVEAWKDDYKEYFQGFDEVYVVLDNDPDYRVASRADNAYYNIRRSLGSRTRRLYLPQGVKDICEFFDSHTVDAFELLIADDTPIWHFEALDLTTDPGPIDWFVDGLIAKGDLCLMIGEPGVGKSWVSMSLAVAVALGSEDYLGRALSATGSRVLYVDEENPELLILHRMKKLGLTEEAAKNIRFLHRQGIRLDRKPQLLHDEALDWKPDVIILDSLTRLWTGDENNAGEVAKLFNDGVNPLARETGATTLLLHHVTKTESPSSFARARGSGDISASIDTGLDLRSTDEAGGFDIALYKSRWVEEGIRIACRRRDEGDRTVVEGSQKRVWF